MQHEARAKKHWTKGYNGTGVGVGVGVGGGVEIKRKNVLSKIFAHTCILQQKQALVISTTVVSSCLSGNRLSVLRINYRLVLEMKVANISKHLPQTRCFAYTISLDLHRSPVK